jgi:hypothetical protein
MSFNYRSITAGVIAAADKKPGHSDVVLFSPTSAFDTIALPTAPFTAMGATKRITANHTFPVNGGWKSIQAKAKSIDATADASGEAGGQVINYKYKVIMKGDSAEINEWFENAANEDGIWLFNDPVCGVNNYVQLGSKCTPAVLSGLAFRSGSKGAGGFKEYEFVVESSDKFFYEGDITMANENPVLGSVGILNVVSFDGTEIVLDWADVANAEEYEIEHGSNYFFTSNVTTQATSETSNYTITTGIFAGEVKYIRVRAVAAGYAPGPWSEVSVTIPD